MLTSRNQTQQLHCIQISWISIQLHKQAALYDKLYMDDYLKVHRLQSCIKINWTIEKGKTSEEQNLDI